MMVDDTHGVEFRATKLLQSRDRRIYIQHIEYLSISQNVIATHPFFLSPSLFEIVFNFYFYKLNILFLCNNPRRLTLIKSDLCICFAEHNCGRSLHGAKRAV